MLIIVDGSKKIIGYNVSVGADMADMAKGFLWRPDLTVDDLQGIGSHFDYYLDEAGGIYSMPVEPDFPTPTEIEILTAKVDYISMVVEGLVLNV